MCLLVSVCVCLQGIVECVDECAWCIVQVGFGLLSSVSESISVSNFVWALSFTVNTLKSCHPLPDYSSNHLSYFLNSLSVLQFPVLSQSSGGNNLGDSSSESGGDVKESELCHHPLLFVTSGHPSLHNGNQSPGPYPQPASPSSRLYHLQNHHHHHSHHLIDDHLSHHHHQFQASQVYT